MVLILFALLMVGIMTVVALAIDLSVVRQTRQGNKSAADIAVAAGLHGLETPQGTPRPWAGVCSALGYLKANHADLTSLAGTFKDGAGSPLPTSPCSSTATAPHTTLCTPTDKSTWAWYSGSADGGRLQVEIKSGYSLPDPEFAEDSDAYSADNIGDPRQGGCDQLAVILRDKDPVFFGGVVGVTGYGTTIRSVGRVDIGSSSEEPVALLILEEHDCSSLVTEGNNTYVRVRATPIGAPTRPGFIQSNSDGSGACSGSTRVIEGSSACSAILSCSSIGPSVVAEDASPTSQGRIGIRAVGANPAKAFTPACSSATSPPAGCTMAPIPIDAGMVTRSPVDLRYLAQARTLKTTAANAGPAGFFVVSGLGCNSTLFSTLTTLGNPRVYLDCSVDVGALGMTFDDSITDVVIAGDLRIQSGRTLIASNVRNFFVKGSGGVNVAGVLKLNQRGAATCGDRFNRFSRAEVTKLVVLNGSFSANGEVDLCNTFMFLAQGGVPSTEGTPPADNTFTGRIDIGSSASLDWRAPNQTDFALDAGDPLLADFEDMALWSEYSGNGTAGNASRIGGQGSVVTSGVFFLPNANPFTMAGGGTGAQVEADAQLIVRKLRLSGTVRLEMAPNPANVVPMPAFERFGLIR